MNHTKNKGWYQISALSDQRGWIEASIWSYPDSAIPLSPSSSHSQITFNTTAAGSTESGSIRSRFEKNDHAVWNELGSIVRTREQSDCEIATGKGEKQFPPSW